MQFARRLLALRQIAFLLCAAVLALKVLVPTGYMIGSDHGRLAVTVCNGMMPKEMMSDGQAVGMAAAGHGDMADHDGSKGHGKVEQPCAFAGLSAPLTGVADSVQLAALIAFVMAAGLLGASLPHVSRPTYLRPPLRGPPIAL